MPKASGLVTALAVLIAWGDGASGTADLRIAGDGFRWVVDLVVLLGTGLSLLLLDADHERSRAYSPEVPVLMLLAAAGMMILAAARDARRPPHVPEFRHPAVDAVLVVGPVHHRAEARRIGRLVVALEERLAGQLGELARDFLRDRDGAGIGQRAEVEAGAADHVGDQPRIAFGETGSDQGVINRAKIGNGDVGQNQVLLVGDAQLVKAIALGNVGREKRLVFLDEIEKRALGLKVLRGK